MTLATLQREFLAAISAGEGELPAGWDARLAPGMAVYRNAYRERLLEAMGETFARTRMVAGEESFRAAAAHHLITNRPSGWTLDLIGEGFPETCAELFRKDPLVAELAALEWAMQCAFTARDEDVLDMAAFAALATRLGDDVTDMRLRPVASLHLVRTTHDLAGLWNSLEGSPSVPAINFEKAGWVIVWREDERPVFRHADPAETLLLQALRRGSTYRDACARLAAETGKEDLAQAAGIWLARWLGEGLLVSPEG